MIQTSVLICFEEEEDWKRRENKGVIGNEQLRGYELGAAHGAAQAGARLHATRLARANAGRVQGGASGCCLGWANGSRGPERPKLREMGGRIFFVFSFF